MGDPADPGCEWADFVVASREPLATRRALPSSGGQLLRVDAIEAQLQFQEFLLN